MKAFPQAQFRGDEPVDTAEHGGLDLRDYFAAKATKDDVKPFFGQAREKAESLFPEHINGNMWRGVDGKIYKKWDDVKEIRKNLLSDPNIWVVAKFLYADAMMEQRNK